MSPSERDNLDQRKFEKRMREYERQQPAPTTGVPPSFAASSHQGGREDLGQLPLEALLSRQQNAIAELRSIAEELARRAQA